LLSSLFLIFREYGVSGSELVHQSEFYNLYTEHHGWLKGWLTKRLNCQEQASDLAQDTFVRVLQQRRAKALRQPRAYLSSIARNLMVDMFRRRSIEQAYLEALALQPEPVEVSPEIRHGIIETLVEIDIMLDSLGERPRQIFLLAQIDGMTFVDISRHLGISVNTVRKHFIRAMSRCLLLMED
jgi:RNA polymerase sigma-70 factor (ECF subfamily)